MSYEVIVAGSGPAGLMLAAELSLAGVPALVVDPHVEPRVESPGVAINNASVELLDQRGLMDPLREGALPLPAAHYSLIPLDMARLGRPHEHTHLLLQSRLEQVLEKRAVELGSVVRRGWAVAGVEQDDTGVTVTVRSDTGEERLRARYLVGCDGRDSAVRGLAGIAFPGEEPPFDGIVGDIDIDPAALRPEQIGAKYSPQGDHYTGAPLEPGVLRVMTAEFGRQAPAADESVTAAELQASVRRLTGTELADFTPRWLLRYGNPTRHADRYRAGRVFLAGDAAHVHFPLNGQALNNCLHDAMNLGWKLAADIRGNAPAGLLDTYNTERRPVGAKSCENVAAQVVLSYPADKVAPLRAAVAELIEFDVVNQHLIDLVTGLGVRYPISYPDRAFGDNSHPLLGRRLPLVPLAVSATATENTPGAAVDVTKKDTAAATTPPHLLRTGRGVLIDLSRGTVSLDGLAGWSDRVDVVAADPSPDLDAAVVLLRPDGHVAWADRTGGDEKGLHLALATWFGPPR